MIISKKTILIIFVLFLIPFIRLSASNNTDIDGVITRMYNNGLTDYSTKSQFQPNKSIRRDEVAKFITEFANNILRQDGEENSICYMFKDIPPKNTLRDYIIQSCELGYMKGKNNKFNPGGYLSNAEAVATVIRMYGGVLNEPKSDRSKYYYKKADELHLLNGLGIWDRRKKISRGNFATLLYRLGKTMDTQYDLGTGYYGNDLYSGTNVIYYSGITASFISGAKTCSGSSNTTEVEFNLLRVDTYIKIYREIRGRENNKCVMYERIEDVSMKINYDILEQFSGTGFYNNTGYNESEGLTGFQELIGKYGICKLSTGYLVNMFQSELLGNFDSPFGNLDNQDRYSNCTGTLFDN